MMQTDTISELGFIAEGGEMGAMIRQKDWTQTSLGAPQHWPNCLKFAVSLMLRSGYPMFLWWGTDHIMLHNDAYLPVLGKKHPDALGSRAAETWSEIWPDIGPLAARVFNGENVYLQDLPLYMQRKGFLEETYWTFSYSPIITDEGEVGGLFCACNEETGKIYGQRRLSILQQITSLGIRSGSPADTAGAAIDILATNNHDIPFAAVFLQDESGRLELAGQTGSGAGGESIDAHIWNTWGIEACKGGAPRVLHNLPFRFTQSPSSNNEMTITKAMVLPMQQNGFLICGIAPSIEWNETYENYLLTISGQVAFVLNSIKAFENERMRAEAMLQLARSKDKAEQELHNLFMQAPFGIIILEGKDFVIRLANDAYLPIVQRKTEELVGKPVFEAVPEVGGQGFEEVLEGVMTTGRPYFHNEVQTTIHRNGREEATYLNIVYQPLRELDGPVTKIMILINEVTDQVLARKKMEELTQVLEREVTDRTKDLKEMNTELERSNRELEQFAYAASHDMQEPLRKIQTFASFLTGDDAGAIPATQLRYINKIQESAKRMSGIIEDLLHYSYQSSEQQFVPTDLNKIVDDVVFDLELLITQKGAMVHYNQLPVIQANPPQMHQLFYNLLNNSLKFSKEDVQPVVRITAEEEGDLMTGRRMARITVSDNGIGFEQEYADKVFQLFKRLNDRYSYSGTGIGLALCKKIVNNHDGTIEASSSMNEGATFIIRLPIAGNE